MSKTTVGALKALVIILTLPILAPAARAQGQSSEETNTWEQRIRENHERRMQDISRRRIQRLTAVAPETRRFRCRIESLLDETVMVSKAYDPKIEPVLQKFGHRKVYEAPDHRNNVLFDGRSYQVFLLRDDVPEWKVEQYIGQEVELELEKFIYGGTSRIVRIREMPRPEVE